MADDRDAPPDAVDRLWTRIQAESLDPASPPARPTVALVVLVVGSAVLGFTPGVGINDMPIDITIPLDAAQRMALGHTLHVDVHTPVGAVYSTLLWLGTLAMGSATSRVLAVANILAAWLALGGALVATRSRLPPWTRQVVVLYVALLAMSPRTLDSPVLVGFNAMYNRWAWAAVAVAGCVAWFRSDPTDDTRRSSRAGALLLAACVIWITWLKVTFLAALGATVLAGLLLVPSHRRILVGGAGFGGLLAVASVLGTSTGRAYVADLQRSAMAASTGPGLLRFQDLPDVLSDNALALGLVAATVVALIRSAPASERDAASVPALGLLVGAAGGLLIAVQNHDGTTPILLLAALAGARHLAQRDDEVPWITAPLAAASLAGMAATVALDLFAILMSVFFVFTGVPFGVGDADGPMGDVFVLQPKTSSEPVLRFVYDGSVPASIYDSIEASWPTENPAILGDADALLRRHGLHDRRIASTTFAPIFPTLYHTPPPKGMLAWYDYQRTFGDAFPDEACTSLADAEVVMRPLVWRIAHLWEVHEDCVRREFILRDETPVWQAWVRPSLVPEVQPTAEAGPDAGNAEPDDTDAR